jgi:hypothetical protein
MGEREKKKIPSLEGAGVGKKVFNSAIPIYRECITPW